MKVILFILINLVMGSNVMTQSDLLAEARSKISQSFQSEEVCDELYEKFLKTDLQGSPILLGYKGALEMAKSKHYVNPFKKLSHFNSGKEMLEQAISIDEKDIELRFLRFQIQYNTPGFLGYKDQLQNDKKFIEANLGSLESEELKTKISSFISKAELD